MSVKLTALSNIDHDDHRYEKGDTLEVSEEQAEALVNVGSAELQETSDDEETEDDDEDESVEIPESFTTVTGEYTTQKNRNGNISRYLLDGNQIKKAEYIAAFEQSQDDEETEDDE